MLTSIRSLTAATFSAGLVLSATPAFAMENGASEAVSGSESAEATTAAMIADEAISPELIAAAAALETEGLSLTQKPAQAEATIQVDRATAPIDSQAASNLGEESGFTFSANIAFATEYRFRGVALTDGEFAVQGASILATRPAFTSAPGHRTSMNKLSGMVQPSSTFTAVGAAISPMPCQLMSG